MSRARIKMTEKEPCPECGGWGTDYNKRYEPPTRLCESCNGTGIKEEHETSK